MKKLTAAERSTVYKLRRHERPSDASGNMTDDGINTLVYDGESHAVSATNGSNSGAYVYDGNGLRVKRCVPNCTSPTTSTVYLFSGSKVIAEYDNGATVGSPSREYIYAGAALLAKTDSSGTKYYHQDHLSNRLVTDSSGNTLAQMGTFPYGESWYNASSDKLLFTTYERDSESTNDYAQARYHVSGLGRFSSPDPISGSTSDPQSLNRYSYVRNMPAMLSDPFGTCPPVVQNHDPNQDHSQDSQSGGGPYVADFADPSAADPPGQGGSLVAWTDYSPVQPFDYITHLGPSGQNDFPFPSLSQAISSMVLGDNGAAYATDSQTIQAFDINSGQSLWTYVSQALDGIAIIASTSGGGLVAKVFLGFRQETPLRFDSAGQPTYDGTGTATPASPFGSGIDYSWRGQWYASLNAMSASLALQPIPVSWASAWAKPEGNASQTNEAVNHHSFGLFWCGTGYGETGSCNNRNDGDDVAFDYFPESNNVSDLHPLSTYNPANFASSNPGFVDIIESEALRAYQKAFSTFGVVVQKGSTHSQGGAQVPDQEFRQYVVGTWPTPGTGKSFPSSGSSNLYYFTFMLGAQDALLNSPNSTFSSPSWPPTAQNNASFLTLMKTIGKGVGNAAAHETGHLLEVIHPPMGSFFHINPGFPYMDCGIGNPDPTGAIHCQNGNNFVYSFFAANGTPQDPNNESSGGGSFFYIDISGHPIHWGPDNVCWLVNWTGPGSCEF